MCHLTERSVYVQLSELEALGLIKRASGGGRTKSNVYTITLNPEPRSVLPRNPELHSVNGVHKTLNHVHKNPELNSPELVQELYKKGPVLPQRKFISELKTQIDVISDEIQRLKDFGRSDDDRATLKQLVGRRKDLRTQLINQ